MISIFFLLWVLYQRWRQRPSGMGYVAWADISVIIIAVYLLIGADSSTSIATLVLGAVAFLSLRLFRKLKLVVPGVGLAALLTFLLGFGALAPFLGGSN